MLMRIVIKTTNNNPIPEIIFSGSNDAFKKDMFMKINQYAYYGYKVSWQTEGLTLTRGDCIIYMRIINHHQGGRRKGVSVTSIGKESFAFCKGLTSIELPNSVTTIGDDAFCNCNPELEIIRK